MKTGKYIFLGIITSLLTLSVLGKNNFSDGFGLFPFDDEPVVQKSEIRDMVRVQLSNPLMNCYVKAHPEVTMTKCPATMRFKFADRWGTRISDEHTFGINENVEGDLIFDDCGKTSHVCSVVVNYGQKEVKVQESFFTEWVPAKDYIESFCDKMKKKKKKS